MLREELLLKGLLGYRRADVLELLDEESTMRAVFGWVIRAWGVCCSQAFAACAMNSGSCAPSYD